MGWTYSPSWPTKAAMIDYCTGEALGGPGAVTTIAKAIRGNVLWTVIEYGADSARYPKGTRAILCFLLGAEKGYGWGYKDMDESMGPCDLSCPIKFLDMVPDPGGFATEWRARVRAEAAKRAIPIAVGNRLILRANCRPTSLICTSVNPLRGVADGITYRIRRALLDRVEAAT